MAVDESLVEMETDKLRAELDDYRDSVKGLYAFAGSAQWDGTAGQLRADSKVSIPRTMTAELIGDEPDQTETRNVTPDGVIQVHDAYGIVVEMKKHFRQGDLKHFEQLRSYDNDLIGWWTSDSRIAEHDLVLLTHQFSGVDAKDAYEAWKEDGRAFDRKFSIVEFGHSDQAKRWYWLRRMDGTDPLSDHEHDKELRRGKKIGEKALIITTQKYEFYDDKPPLIHMLIRLQHTVLPVLLSEEQFDSETEGGHPTVVASAEDVRLILQDHHYPERHVERQPELPKLAWVQEALVVYSKMGLARLEDPEEDLFRIILKKPQVKDFVRYFAKKLLEIKGSGEMKPRDRASENVARSPVQRLLFEDN